MNNLFEYAKSMQKRAHAPYSNFQVGAALQTEDYKIIGGCNIENSSYGLTMCAERVAIGNAIAQGHTKFHALAVVSPTGGFPCGACRQVISDMCGNILIYICTPHKTIQTITLNELLPHSFSEKDLHTNESHIITSRMIESQL